MVVIYSRVTCSPCASAKKLMDRWGIKYEVKDVDLDKGAAEELATKYGYTMVPVIVSGDVVIAGNIPQEIAKLRGL
jgi:glutaredoxin-like protein NrdH